jgi:TfoX/Sxy family transcriptional regulator of competence genes
MSASIVAMTGGSPALELVGLYKAFGDVARVWFLALTAPAGAVAYDRVHVAARHRRVRARLARVRGRGPGLEAQAGGVLMAYDEALAERIRAQLAGADDVIEQRMFGGLAFLIGGYMAVAASGQGGLMLRCDPDDTETLAAEPHAGRFVMRGRAMSGWLRVDADGVQTEPELRRWVERGVAYARSLPPKA